jgi:type I restriction enzyme, R subunit
MPRTQESDLENIVLDYLKEEGYGYEYGELFEPEVTPERDSYHGAILTCRFKDAVTRINPDAPPEAIDRAVNAVLDEQFPDLLQENRRIHRLLIDGVPVDYQKGGETINDRLKLIDWEDQHNEWLAVNQFTVVGSNRRRPDVVLFLNGLPVVVLELKSAERESAGIRSAYNQLQTYKAEIPALFRSNLIGIISDGFSARYGSISADINRFMAWRTIDGVNLVSPTSQLAVETLVKGLLRPDILLQLLRHFTVFEDDGRSVIKKVAGYHQFHAGLKGLSSVQKAVSSNGKGGVVWHTQGSGKSLLMAFLGGMLVRSPELENPTLLVLTDRNDLDNQLFATFSKCSQLLGQTPEQVQSVPDLRTRLDRQVGGVVFATIQKFRPGEDNTFPVITERRNVIVFVDEAHRSQYGFGAKIDVDSGRKSYGFAYYVRKGLPNAAFVGFTGTPVELVDKNTKEVFGDYIDIYDISQAVEDKATVPIHYEGKIVRLQLDDDTRNAIDLEFDDATEQMDDTEKARVAAKWSKLEALAGVDERLDELAGLIVKHFDRRQQAIQGKGMVVCMSRRICVGLYERISRLRPGWHDPADDKGKMKVVMTGAASDPEEFRPHIRNKSGLDQMARRFRDPEDEFQLVIVRDMWLTGFDAPSLHTLYVDKPMKGHSLMQAIARVNRIFRDKPAGLVVDTIGIATDLKEALSFYSDKDRNLTGVDMEEAVAILLECLDVMRSMFHSFDYSDAISGEPADRLRTLAAAVEFVYGLEGDGDENRKEGRKRFLDAVAKLEKAFKLASGSEAAAQVTDEVAFFSGVRITLRKLEGEGTKGAVAVDIDAAIQRLVSQAVVSTEVVDLLNAAGIKSPDISVLSDEFLKEMESLPHKNLAAEALRRLLNGEMKARTRTNVVRSRQFTDRIEDAMAKYHNRVIDALQVIEELIRIAKDLREEPEDGLSNEEAALYDALADNESALEVMGNEELRLIASELVTTIRDNSSVDWWRFEQRRTQIRVAVKRILRKYGYPPDLQEEAIKTVVLQAEALAMEVAA